MSGSGGGLATVTTLLRQLIQSVTGAIAAINAAAPVTSSQPANQFLASPSASAGTPAFRAITQADLVAIKQALPIGVCAESGNGVTSFSVTTGALTASSDGAAIILSDGSNTTGSFLSLNPSSSLSGLITVSNNAGGYSGFCMSYLPMSAGQTSTFTLSATVAAGAFILLSVRVFFLPLA